MVDFAAQGGAMYITKLDVMKKQYKRELIKINILHQRDIDAEKASKEDGANDPNKMIMEEMKYYENLDLEKLEDERQREEREKRE